jgi:hypothetical protein
MTGRYLFGPVSANAAAPEPAGPHAIGACLTFGPAGAADVPVEHGDCWEAIAARLPEGWHAEFVVLSGANTGIPPGLWSAPVPLVALAADGRRRWHACRPLRPCDLILTDPATADTLVKEGLTHALAADLPGGERAAVERPEPAGPRDIDVLFLGGLDPVTDREGLPWLGRLARLGERWRVAVAAAVGMGSKVVGKEKGTCIFMYRQWEEGLPAWLGGGVPWAAARPAGPGRAPSPPPPKAGCRKAGRGSRSCGGRPTPVPSKAG